MARDGRRRLRRRSSSDSGSDAEAGVDVDAEGVRAARWGRGNDERLSFEHVEATRGVTLLTRNEYPLAHLPRDKLLKSDDAHAECYCTFPASDEPHKSRCDDVSCLNFATYIECSPSRCDAGKYCRNQRLQHPERFPALEPFKTEHKGFGVRARDEIEQGAVIGEYVGEIIDEKEMQRRLQGVPRHELNFYYLALEPGVYIDARNKGSFTRFMNHSCEPNCKTEKWTVKGETRIAVVAIRAIAEKEELTFDYQWKSLGSQQIKCHCGSVNCKGVIGAEVDASKTVVDSGMHGFYREPTDDEIGDALVDRRIRLFLSATDTSIYAIAIVKAYHAVDGTYELLYEESMGTPEENSLDSPQSDGDDDLRSQPFVKLSERNWQVYAELQGLSDDQVEQAFFSIPKRRPSGTAGDASQSPSKSDPTATTTSPSQSSTTPPSTPSTAVFSQAAPVHPPLPQQEQRDQHGELLDVDGDIVTTKLLIKGLPSSCDDALLRRLFAAPRHSRASSMLERLQSSVVAQRSTSDIVVKLDYFFFDDTSGWALVEFSDSSYTKIFRKNLNSRDLMGNQLRVFFAGRREVDNFERSKRNAAIRREEALARQQNDASNTCSSKMGYPYGCALDWLVSPEMVEDSPSRRKGMSATTEDMLRAQYVNLIVRVTRALPIERSDAASAVLALHRIFTFRPMSGHNIESFAAGMLHIVLMARSRKIQWPDFVSEVYAARYPKLKAKNAPTTRLDPRSEAFKHCERQILETEMELLEGLLYDITCEDPYRVLEVLTGNCKTHRSVEGLYCPPEPVPPEVQREARHLINDVLGLPVWAHTSVECVTLSILYVSTAVIAALAYSMTDEKFEPCMLPSFLPSIDPVKHEKDVLALLECSFFIADSLKERWHRLEKYAKADRDKARAKDYFDTEQFAVRRNEQIEITLRITALLKKWIDLTAIADAEGPVNQIGLSQLRCQDTFEGAEDVVRVKASDSMRRNAGPKSQVVMPPRLHVRDIDKVDQIRKRTYLGVVSSSLESLDVAGTPVYLQPWPYREHEPIFSVQNGVSRPSARELWTAMSLTSRAPRRFLPLVGIVFPDGEDNRTDDLDLSFEDAAKTSLRKSSHYCAFAQPLHLYSGLLDAKVSVPPPLKKRAIFDMLQALALCHDWNFVHRYVAPCHLFVFKDGVRLGGFQAVRKWSSKTHTKSGEAPSHELSDTERKEHLHGSWLQVSAPEILLGDRVFSWRGDIWSAGCVALAILFDHIPFLQGADLKAQLNLIYRQCGTPDTVWPEGAKLPQYGALKPKHEYKMRLRKTLLEQRQEKNMDVPTEAIDVLEAMLQLDPSKRSSARKLLGMPYFGHMASQQADFSALPQTFAAQRRKFQHQMTKSLSSSKRRRGNDIERPGSASSIESDSRRASLNGDVEMDQDDFVPLPAMLQEVTMNDTEAKRDAPVVKKRAKLGWGMGLNS